MTRLVVVEGGNSPKRKTSVIEESLTEGEQARRLLEQNDYLPRRDEVRNGQLEFYCPFHESPGKPTSKHKTNFYLNATTSQFYCQSASCSEQGNLRMLEQYFGVDTDPVLATRFKSKDTQLKEFEIQLTTEHRRFLREEKGLNDDTIARFRIGYDTHRDAYVIPYLETRRPVAFRFYSPKLTGPNGSKYWWESAEDSIGTFSDDSVLRLFNPGAAVGDENGRVFICEGELKAMMLSQWGFAAVGIPGVTGFKQEWARFFMNAKEIFVAMDNDNPEFHKHAPCRKCGTTEKDECAGHNPGQDGAAKLLDFFGYRGRNVLLPLPPGERKTDINEYVMRDKHAKHEFLRLALGLGADEQFMVRSLEEIRKDPPPEAVFLIGGGLLPRSGRLLVTGSPKVGKSIFVQNLVLSLASGIPFLGRFWPANTGLTPGHRVLLLDRELSERSLLDRLEQLIQERPGYSAAEEKLLIDHRFRLAIDQPGADQDLISLIKANNAECVVLDTAYKFFASGDIESSKSLSRSFANLDAAIAETGVTVILTHHHRKGSNAKNEAPSPDAVVGSFLWTGWANGTVLLNFKNRSVSDPYTTIASFAAFRDSAPPEALLLHRDKDSISYREVEDYSFDDAEEIATTHGGGHGGIPTRPDITVDRMGDLLLRTAPVAHDVFVHQSAGYFGVSLEVAKRFLLDATDRHRDKFVRTGRGTKQDPYTWRFTGDKQEETYEEEMARIDQMPDQQPIDGFA